MVLNSVKNILEFNQIDCYIKNQHGHTMGPEFGLDNTMLELWLPDANDYDRATAIIEEQVLTQEPGDPWSCKKCGEENEGNFAVCWKCQTPHE